MQHADETQLSAYLDKQLEYADSDRRRELGRHIADCSKCSKLLKEMRSIRTEAEELLGRADTVSVAAPSFEAVVQRARAIRTGEIEIDTPEVSESLPSTPSRSAGVSGIESPVLSTPAPPMEVDEVDEEDLVDEGESVEDMVEEPVAERESSPTLEEADHEESSSADTEEYASTPSFESAEHEPVSVDPDSDEDEEEDEEDPAEVAASEEEFHNSSETPAFDSSELQVEETDIVSGVEDDEEAVAETPSLEVGSFEERADHDSEADRAIETESTSFDDGPPAQPAGIEITQDGADSLLDVPDLDIGREDDALEITRDLTPEPTTPPSDIDTGGLEIQHGAGYDEQHAPDTPEPAESSPAFDSFEEPATEKTVEEPAPAAPTFDTTPDFDAAPPSRPGAEADGAFLDVLGPEFGADDEDEGDGPEVETAYDSATAESASSQPEPEPEPAWEEAEVQPSPSWDEPDAKAARPWDEADLQTNVAPPPADKPDRPWNETDLETNVAPPPATPVHSTPARPVAAHREDIISLRKDRTSAGQSARPKSSRRFRALAMAATVVLAASAGLFADRLGIIDVPFVGDALSPSQGAGVEQTLLARTSEAVADGDNARDEAPRRNREAPQQRAAPPERQPIDVSAPTSVVLPEAAIQAAEEATEFTDALSPSERALRGRVLDDATGRPVAGVRLELEGSGLSSTTDSTGQYVMANAPPGDVTLRANAAGYESQEKVVSESDRKDAADFRMARPAETLDAPARRDQAARALGEAGAPAQAQAPSAAAKRVAPSFNEPGWTEIDREEAETLLGGPLYVVRNRPIELVARSNDGSVMVRQTVAGGDPLELVIRRAAGREGENELLEGEPSVEGGPNGGSRGTIRKGDYIITANAPVPRAELERLLLGLSEAPRAD